MYTKQCVVEGQMHASKGMTVISSKHGVKYADKMPSHLLSKNGFGMCVHLHPIVYKTLLEPSSCSMLVAGKCEQEDATSEH